MPQTIQTSRIACHHCEGRGYWRQDIYGTRYPCFLCESTGWLQIETSRAYRWLNEPELVPLPQVPVTDLVGSITEPEPASHTETFPSRENCPRCGGSGYWQQNRNFPCFLCGRRGWVVPQEAANYRRSRREREVHLPPPTAQPVTPPIRVTRGEAEVISPSDPLVAFAERYGSSSPASPTAEPVEVEIYVDLERRRTNRRPLPRVVVDYKLLSDEELTSMLTTRIEQEADWLYRAIIRIYRCGKFQAKDKDLLLEYAEQLLSNQSDPDGEYQPGTLSELQKRAARSRMPKYIPFLIKCIREGS